MPTPSPQHHPQKSLLTAAAAAAAVSIGGMKVLNLGASARRGASDCGARATLLE